MIILIYWVIVSITIAVLWSHVMYRFNRRQGLAGGYLIWGFVGYPEYRLWRAGRLHGKTAVSMVAVSAVIYVNAVAASVLFFAVILPDSRRRFPPRAASSPAISVPSDALDPRGPK